MQNIEIRNSSHAFYEFLEVCKLPLPSGIKIYKKGYLLKKSGGRFRENKLQTYAGVFCKRWLQRWFLISEEGFLYTINSLSTQIREVLNFDQSFKIEYGTKETGTKFGITIITSTRKIYLRAPDFFQALDWISSIQDAVKNCAYVNINRFYSFAPVRNPTSFCKWYIDGEGYFNDVYEAIIKATKEVFLTGWWISPELYLKRPVSPDNTEFRLDKVLQKIASRGVKINIILYREVKLALNNDSAYTKSALQSLSPNIKVIRHPKEFLFLWSHHEKMVVVDQSIAFLGGLDLCYGRMDTNSHPLHDPASLEGQGETFPGIDYANPRIADFRNVREYSNSLIEKNVVPRLPWHDIAMMVVGEPVKDLTRHFIQTWNFAQIELNGKKDSFIIPKTIHRPKNEDKTESKSKNLKLKAARLKSKMKTILKLQTNSQKNAAESSDK